MSSEMDLLEASEKGDLNSVKQIIKTNPNAINFADEDGYTSLHRASYNNHVDVIHELIHNGADIHRTTNDGWRPLHSAVHWNSFNAASVLLHAGVRVNEITNGGQTALHLALNSSKSVDSIMLLLWWPFTDHKLVNQKGDSPSQIAKRTGKEQYLLLKCKKDYLNVI